MKALVSIIALAILSLTALSCAQPVAPTATAYPTDTPYPTLADIPTHTHTHTPSPTLELPTHTPYPTPTFLPTYTPSPTLEPPPTLTPYPTPTALPTYIPDSTIAPIPFDPLPTLSLEPFPTLEPLPTLVPLPTPVLTLSLTELLDSITYRTYTSDRHQFDVSIPNDWDIDYDGESLYTFRSSSLEVSVAVQIWNVGTAFPLSTYAEGLAARLEDFEVLESYAIGSNRWYLRGRYANSSCDFESRFHFFRAEKVYSVYEAGCPLFFTKWKEPLERFRTTLRFW